MDIPFEGPFNGYGVNAGQPAGPTATPSYADEVRARAAKLQATPAAAPAGPAAPVTGVRPRFPVPAWLKTAGGFGARLLGPLGAAAALTPMVQGAFEGGAELAARGGSNMAPNPAVQAAQPAPVAAPAAELPPVGDDAVTMGQKNLATAMAPTFGRVGTPNDTAVPTAGTGYITNNQTGKTTYVGSPSYGAAPRDYTGGNAAASFFQAGALLKQNANDNALSIARAKANSDAVAKSAEAFKNTAQGGNFGVRTLAASEHLRANPGDFAGAGAVAAGRVPASKNVFLPTMDASKVDVGNTGTGQIVRKTVQAPVTEADIQKTMLSNKLTREQVMKRLKDEGRM